MNKFIFTLALFVLSFQALAAPSKETPEIIVSGFSSYQEGGPKPAIESWIKGSAIEGSKEALAQSNMLSQIADYFGKYNSYELVKKSSLSSKSNLYLIVMNFEKGILFAKFTTYVQPNGKEIVQAFNFNTDADKVWPSSAIYK